MLVVALKASGWPQQHYYGLNNNRSIVIGDEVCKGTEDVSAVAIVGTTIKHLISKETKFIFAKDLAL